MDHPAPQPPSPQFPPLTAASAPASPYSALHPLLLPSPNPHLLLKPRSLTLSLSSSSLGSMASSPRAPAPDAWEFVAPTAPAAAHVDGGLDDCAIFPPRLHEGLGLEGEPEEAAAVAASGGAAATKEVEVEGEKEEEEEDGDGWGWSWERCRSAARRAWEAGVEAVQERVLVHGACGCTAVRPAVWSAAAATVAVGALLYARRRDRKERDLLLLLSQEKDKRIAQLLHQIALMSDIRSGSEAVKIIRSS
ncbi:hypothetical protein PR202_ga29319 [Eleusine coracana subsp. coracana]|uniref:Uncharacterized protein n=1 Tax=Eleusine coracana subsp. coracana TaxID=191504 RepID=A0AAV5DKV8_ELECO|nr:hypothetical protein PR202_ga29319 [Eleusine coracana subsp. coracana]